MNRYTIRCTDEETRKALELGAPIEYHCPNKHERFYHIPTAEQMVGWIKDQDVVIDTDWSWGGQVTMWVWYNPEKELIYTSHANSLKDATLESIDAALEFLYDIKWLGNNQDGERNINNK